jgi:hypothetical protein
MSSNDRALVIGVLAVVALAGIGAAVHVVPWRRDNRSEIGLCLLMLLLVASGFTAALALIVPYADRPPPADELDSDNADTDTVCPQSEGAYRPTPKSSTADRDRLCDCCYAHTALSPLPAGRNPNHDAPGNSDDQQHNSCGHRG